MVDVAVALLKPGGTLVYSTCTINPDENEQVIKHALTKYKGLTLMFCCYVVYPILGVIELVPPPPEFHLGEKGLSTTSLDEEELANVQRFDPTAALDTIGFFIAKLRKIQSTKHDE